MYGVNVNCVPVISVTVRLGWGNSVTYWFATSSVCFSNCMIIGYHYTRYSWLIIFNCKSNKTLTYFGTFNYVIQLWVSKFVTHVTTK